MKAKLIKINTKYYLRLGYWFPGYKYLDNSMNAENPFFDTTWTHMKFIKKNACFSNVQEAQKKWELYKQFKGYETFKKEVIGPLY